jgi:hypothetical protein
MEEYFIYNKKTILLASLFIVFIIASMGVLSAADTNNTHTNTHIDKKLVNTTDNTNTEVNKIQSKNKINIQKDKIKNIKSENTITANTSSTTTKKDANITLDNYTAKTNSNITISPNISSDVTGNVVYKLNGKTISPKISITNGTAVYNYKIPMYTTNKYNLTMVYSGNDVYQPATVTSELTLTKLNTNVKVTTTTAKQSKTTQIHAIVTDENGLPVNNTKVVFKVNGKTLGQNTTINGLVDYYYNFNNQYTNTSYKLEVTSGENNYYNTSKSTTNLKIVQNTKTTIKPIKSETGKVVTFNSTVKDMNGRNVNTGIVQFKLNGKTMGNATVRNGVAVLSNRIDLLNAGVYKITATYLNNNNYQTSTGTNNITLSKIATKTSASKFNITIDQSGNITITTLDHYNKPVTKGTVYVEIDKKNWGNHTLRNGTYKFTCKLPYRYSNTNTSIKVLYYENGVYKSSTYNGRLTINPLKVVYVGPKGSDSNSGRIGYPFKTIKYAVAHVANNGVVYVLPGVYKETGILVKNSMNITGLTKNPNNVVISGNNTKWHLMNITSANSTVIISNMAFKNATVTKTGDGVITSKGVLSVNNCIFDNDKSNAIRAASAIYSEGYLYIINSTISNNKVYKTASSAIININNEVILNKVNFNNNQAYGNNPGSPALYLFNTNSTIYGSKFINNKANGANATGGAVKLAYGNATFNKVTFTNNIATGTGLVVGGAIANLNARLIILNSSITNNTAQNTKNIAYGGALFNQNSILLIINTTFSLNKITGQSGSGGAVYGYDTFSSIVNSRFTYNKITAKTKDALGGAISIYTGTINAQNNIFNRNTITGNVTYGAGIYFIGSTFNMSQNTFTNNNAQAKSASAGGAIFTYGNTTITKSNFQSNKATGRANGGGAIANIGNLTVHTTNIINNVASAAGSAMSNGGTIKSITGNYWGSRSPSWKKLLYRISKPSSYSKTKINN